MGMAFVFAFSTLVKVKTTVLLRRSSENGVDLKSIRTSAVKARGLVVALNALANTSVCTSGTLINVLTDAASSFVAGVACAGVAADCVGTGSMVGALVATATLVNVGAVETVTAVTSVALASVHARHVGTRSI